MTQDMKFPFQGFGFGGAPFAWPKTGAAFPDMGSWASVQQEMTAAVMQFGQGMMAMAKGDAELAGEVMRKLMLVKTPEEFAAWQRDMSEFVGSKYFEQWTKFGEQVQAIFAKVVAPPKAEAEGAAGLKKAA